MHRDLLSVLLSARKDGLMLYSHEKFSAQIQKAKKTVRLLSLILVASVCVNCYSMYRIADMQKQVDAMHDELKDSREANKEVLTMLKDVRNTQERQNQYLQISLKKKHDLKIQKTNIMLLKATGISGDTDLGTFNNLSVEDMDKIIDYYDSKINGGSRFKGKGYAFIAAAKETGLNPVYLFAHAACESAFGNSYLARTRNNYFGINAVDSNPGLADVMGDGVDEGIMNGAKWIKSNFYDNGYKTLNSMHNAGYATAANWSTEIQDIANSALAVI